MLAYTIIIRAENDRLEATLCCQEEQEARNRQEHDEHVLEPQGVKGGYCI